METKVNLIENRLFIRLDNEWYLVNKHNRTTNILTDDAEGMYIWNWLNSKGIPWEVK